LRTARTGPDRRGPEAGPRQGATADRPLEGIR